MDRACNTAISRCRIHSSRSTLDCANRVCSYNRARSPAGAADCRSIANAANMSNNSVFTARRKINRGIAKFIISLLFLFQFSLNNPALTSESPPVFPWTLENPVPLQCRVLASSIREIIRNTQRRPHQLLLRSSIAFPHGIP